MRSFMRILFGGVLLSPVVLGVGSSGANAVELSSATRANLATRQGGESSGGGNGSTRSSGMAEFKKALLFALDESLLRNAFAGSNGSHFGRDWMFAKESETGAALRAFHDLARTQLNQVRSEGRLKILETEACQGSHGTDSDAAVDAFHLSSTICLSAARLQRYSPRELSTQIAGLIVHEMTHQFGFGEKTATAVQRIYLEEWAGESWHLTPSAARVDLASTLEDNIRFFEERLARLNDIEKVLSWTSAKCDPNVSELPNPPSPLLLNMRFLVNWDIVKLTREAGERVLAIWRTASPSVATEFEKLLEKPVSGFEGANFDLQAKTKHACDPDTRFLLQYRLQKARDLKAGALRIFAFE